MTNHFILITLLVLSLSTVHSQVEDGYCGLDGNEYATVEAAHNAGTSILNCGPCGACSTLNDVKVYEETKNNLTKVSRMCAVVGLIHDYLAKKCLDWFVGFTEECTKCWVENIKCDQKQCKWVCIWSLITGEDYVDEEGNLNKCLQCDEDKCGPAFKECAGANRRRSCIVSDIMRDDKLICKECDKLE